VAGDDRLERRAEEIAVQCNRRTEIDEHRRENRALQARLEELTRENQALHTRVEQLVAEQSAAEISASQPRTSQSRTGHASGCESDATSPLTYPQPPTGRCVPESEAKVGEPV
jgi:phage shock protein A